MNTNKTLEVEEIEYEEAWEFAPSAKVLHKPRVETFITTLNTKHQEELEKAVEAENHRVISFILNALSKKRQNEVLISGESSDIVFQIDRFADIVRASAIDHTKTDKQTKV